MILRRNALSLALTMSLVGLVNAQTSNDHAAYYTVEVETILVRSGAHHSYYPFAKLERGDVVQVTGEADGWARVLAAGPAFADTYGYVKYASARTDRIRMSGDGTAMTLGRADIIAPNLNSERPSESWRTLLRLQAGETIEIIETFETDRETVHRVVLPPTAPGWVNAAQLRPSTAEEIELRWTVETISAPDVLVTTTPVIAAESAPAGAAGDGIDPELADAVLNIDPVRTSEPSTPDSNFIAQDDRPRPMDPSLQGSGSEVILTDTVVVEESTALASPETAFEPAADPEVVVAVPLRAPTPSANGENALLFEPRTFDESAYVDTTMTEREVTDTLVIVDPEDDVIVTDTVDETVVTETTDTLVMTETELEDGTVVGTIDLVETTKTTTTDTETIAVVEIPAEQQPLIPDDLTVEQLDAIVKRMSSSERVVAELDPLIAMYADIASTTESDREAAYCELRVRQLEVWKSLQERRARIAAVQVRAQQESYAAQAIRRELISTGGYTAVGRVSASTIYDGISLPRLLRLQDVATGRTLAYVQPNAEFDFNGMIGTLVGVSGAKRYEGSLGLNVIDPARVDILAANTAG